MRTKSSPQGYLDFTAASSSKIVLTYRQKYAAISKVLEANPRLLTGVHGDLAGALSLSEGGRRSGYTSEQVLRARFGAPVDASLEPALFVLQPAVHLTWTHLAQLGLHLRRQTAYMRVRPRQPLRQHGLEPFRPWVARRLPNLGQHADRRRRTGTTGLVYVGPRRRGVLDGARVSAGFLNTAIAYLR